MRVSSIEIKNYRQYKDQKFEFKKNGEHDLHLIIASNGVGKTNFLNAITWCLYNQESHLGIKSKSLPILNVDVIERLAEGEECEVSVTVKFVVDGKKVIASRKTLPQKRENRPNKVYIPNTTYEVSIIDEGDSSRLPIIKVDREATDYMNRFLPEGINEYFFFDSEQLDHYFLDNESETIKTAIIELSQVELLSRAKRHLDEVMTEYKATVKRNNPDLEKAQKDVDFAKQTYNDIENSIKDINQQIATSKRVINDNKQILKGAPNIKQIEEEIDEINRELEENKQEARENIKNIREFIRRYNIVLRMYPELKRTLEIIEEQEDKGNLPMEISLEILKDMMLTQHCKFRDGVLCEEASINIDKMIEKIKFTNKTSSLLMSIKSEIIRLIEEAKQYPFKKDEVWKKYKELEQRRDELTTLKNLKRDTIATRVDSKQLKNYIIENEYHEGLLKENEDKLVLSKQHLLKAGEKVMDAEATYNRALNKSTKNFETKKLLEFSQKAYNILDLSYTQLVQEMNETITLKTFETFSSLIWKIKTYKKVIIDDNFNIDLIHMDGYSCLGSCSAAERALLALSFTLSLHKVSGFEAPLVIDSPVGRVSDTNRENFGKVLTRVSKEKQLIMLFTPSEYSDEIKPLFQKCASNIYMVSTVDERASLIEGGFNNV